MKKIISIILLATMVTSLVACGKNKPKVDIGKADKADGLNSADVSSMAELAKIDLTKTLTNSEHCDMKYEMSMPDFEFEKDYPDLENEKYSSYTRVYKTTDKNLKYYVTEYLGTEKYVGHLDNDYGQNSRTEARSIFGHLINNLIKTDTGYTDNMHIVDNFATDIGNGIEIYKCCLQLPNELDDYYYVKGYIAVGIKHPVAVYFFDGTPETSYDEEMQAKSLAIIQSLKISE